MCGRYVIVSKLKEIEKRFQLLPMAQPELYEPGFNKGHGHRVPVIASDNLLQLQCMQFGFTPHWAKKNMYLINARAEGDLNPDNDKNYSGRLGILQKPAFRESIRKKRCLIIADAFYEGAADQGLKNPYLVYLINRQRPFAFAGIWDEWQSPAGDVIRSVAIITTVANRLLETIGHHRSPVILRPEQEKNWLDANTPLSEILNQLHPYDWSEMNAYPVSPRVSRIREDDAGLVEPVGQRVFTEKTYAIEEELKLEGMGSTQARVRKQNEGSDKGNQQTSLF